MLALPDKWGPCLARQPETGMGYQVVAVTLHDGRRFAQAVVVGGHLACIRGLKEIPFTASDIADLVVTHAKWDWRGER